MIISLSGDKSCSLCPICNNFTTDKMRLPLYRCVKNNIICDTQFAQIKEIKKLNDITVNPVTFLSCLTSNTWLQQICLNDYSLISCHSSCLKQKTTSVYVYPVQEEPYNLVSRVCSI